MPHISHWAKVAPDRTATLMAASGEAVTYGELDAASNRVAHLLRSRGLRTGDGIVIVMENHSRFLEICWGAQRSGLYFTPASWRLKPDELTYILENSGAAALFVTPRFADVAREAADRAALRHRHRFIVGGNVPGFESYATAVAGLPRTPIADEALGRDMLYSSGTTGLPKGIKNALSDAAITSIPPVMAFLTKLYGFDEQTINLTPAPLYHAGPLRYSMCIGHTGGMNVIMESFAPELALELIQRHRITHAEMVPTMFVRWLKLPESVRRNVDLSSLKMVIHGTGPCAPETKRAMIEWLGPILHEQYGGTEGNGLCVIDSNEWLSRPGSVGKAVVGQLRVLDSNGRELPAGEDGLIYFEGGPKFEYHGDPEKTRTAYSSAGWSTLSDVGHVDDEGYLFLTDRLSHMIISGGVNIYPQEIENVLIAHPSVFDVAVFGVPDEEFGESVMAVVHPVNMTHAGPELARELVEYCRRRMSTIKCPRAIDFSQDLPRHETGKIYKRLLKEKYVQATRSPG
ncbi:MAG: acyl-CoA synthetase [Steroidobacteraceae bacterium]